MEQIQAVSESLEPPSSTPTCSDATGDEANEEPPPASRSSGSAVLTRRAIKDPWATVPAERWNDWRWQMQHRLQTLAQFEEVLELSDDEREGIRGANGRFSIAVTPHFARLMDPHDPSCPIRRQVVPSSAELIVAPADMEDPCGEDHDMVTPGLVHRYPDRVLLLALDTCAAYCRYCTRSRLVGAGEMGPSMPRLEAAFAYLREHAEVRDVLISGGDPLLMADDKIREILQRLRAIPHIEFVRLGTRIPCFLPQRITPGLVAALRAGGPAWLSLHFSHPNEITPEVVKACNLLADGGIPLGNQTVLLKGINDDAAVLKRLFHELLKIRVRPYYLYQCDPVTGTSHLRTSVRRGMEIMEQLRGHTTGYAVPTYVIDAPGGGGKIPVSPDYVVAANGGRTVLRNYRGETFTYHDP